MNKNIEIKNCFEFVCPENWNNFEKTYDENVKFCCSCERQVFKASDKKTFHELSGLSIKILNFALHGAFP